MSKYTLEKHPKKKGVCPNCGQSEVFRYYQDEEGNRIEQQYGRCDRENSCGYHLKPRKERSIVSAKYRLKTEEIIYPDKVLNEKLIACTKIHLSYFHTFCNKLTISNNHLEKWNVGTDKDKTVYVICDDEGKITNAKWFRYMENGRRDKTFKSHSLKQPINPGSNNQKYVMCLYGAHLLDREKSKVVCLVESEKTAVIASFFYPQFDWLSCGSANGLTDTKISVLHGRTIYWLSDADKSGRSNSSINKLKAYNLNYHVVDLFPERADGYDLADAIIDGLRPEIKPTKQSPQAELQKLPQRVNDDFFEYGFFEKDGSYFTLSKELEEIAVSNFTMRVLFLIQAKNPKRVLEIKNVYGKSKILSIETNVLVSFSEFNKAIESQGNFLFYGKEQHLMKIKSKLYKDEKPSVEIATLGWHTKGSFYSFANGLWKEAKLHPIDEYGVVHYADMHYYIPYMNNLSGEHAHQEDNEDYKNFCKFRYFDHKVSFKDWAKLFVEVFGDNGKIGLIYTISAIFRDIIFEKIRRFPHLFLFGQPGTGKSTMGTSLMNLFGIPQEAISLEGESSGKSYMRKIGQFRNALVFLEEYKNTIDIKKIGSLKNIYDGLGYETAVKSDDNRTKGYPVRSALMIAGQEMPTIDPALFTRCIMLEYTSKTWQVEKFNELSLLERKGLTAVTCEIIDKGRRLVEANFEKTFDKIFKKLQADYQGKLINDRLLRNNSILLAIMELISKDLTVPFTLDDLTRISKELIETQAALMNSSDDVQRFWDTVQYLYEMGSIQEGKEYQLDGDTLYIRFSKIYPLYLEAFRRQYNKTGLAKETLINYIKANKSLYRGEVKSKKFNYTNRDGTKQTIVTSAYILVYNRLNISLTVFNEEVEKNTHEKPTENNSLF